MDYQKLMDLRNRDNPFASLLNMRLVRLEEGYAEVTMPVTGQLCNPAGTIHGGCLYALADTAAGAAAATYGRYCVTVSGNYSYLRPAREQRLLRASARAVSHGKTLVVLEVRITGDQPEPLLGESLFTYLRTETEICL